MFRTGEELVLKPESGGLLSPKQQGAGPFPPPTGPASLPEQVSECAKPSCTLGVRGAERRDSALGQLPQRTAVITYEYEFSVWVKTSRGVHDILKATDSALARWLSDWGAFP